ncbi:DUF6973 domain-containing protein, partial [Parapedobacter tibetensis]|uniref:DUF6973 domain-containing protein n=1 Tax=Parapedobacter tibetensis TaxID=2972951 RepID=UPI00214DB28A
VWVDDPYDPYDPYDPGYPDPGEGDSSLTPSEYTEFLALQDQYLSRMTTEERDIYDNMSLVNKYAYLSNAYRAETLAEALFPTSLWNGTGDAFRHGFFHALNSVSIGTHLSMLLGDAHEANASSGLALEKAMDLFNNAFGRTFAADRGIGQTPQDFILQALEDGQLRYLTPLAPNGAIVPGLTELKPTNQ